jgi:CheY-like chemotaxis protein
VDTRRILLLEDQAETRALLKLALESSGYVVLAAEDAVEAGKLLRQGLPSLIIADIQMPYMTGDEFVKALRADPSTRDIPVIFLSADERLEQHARKLGAVAYFDKRVSVEKLLEVVAFYAPQA